MRFNPQKCIHSLDPYDPAQSQTKTLARARRMILDATRQPHFPQKLRAVSRKGCSPDQWRQYRRTTVGVCFRHHPHLASTLATRNQQQRRVIASTASTQYKASLPRVHPGGGTALKMRRLTQHPIVTAQLLGPPLAVQTFVVNVGYTPPGKTSSTSSVKVILPPDVHSQSPLQTARTCNRGTEKIAWPTSPISSNRRLRSGGRRMPASASIFAISRKETRCRDRKYRQQDVSGSADCQPPRIHCDNRLNYSSLVPPGDSQHCRDGSFKSLAIESKHGMKLPITGREAPSKSCSITTSAP